MPHALIIGVISAYLALTTLGIAYFLSSNLQPTFRSGMLVVGCMAAFVYCITAFYMVGYLISHIFSSA